MPVPMQEDQQIGRKSELNHETLGESPVHRTIGNNDVALSEKSVDPGFVERCRAIPMRLTERERELLVLLNSALEVSEYTDNVDVLNRCVDDKISIRPSLLTRYRWNKGSRMIREIEMICATCIGLKVCSDIREGSSLLECDFKENKDFLQEVFEVGRRYKIMNPDKMRTTYGKLMYMLQVMINCV